MQPRSAAVTSAYRGPVLGQDGPERLHRGHGRQQRRPYAEPRAPVGHRPPHAAAAAAAAAAVEASSPWSGSAVGMAGSPQQPPQPPPPPPQAPT
ncbi:hypothetical protein STEG23_001161 [Scotinomys teguina]